MGEQRSTMEKHEVGRAVFFDLDDTLYDQREPFRNGLKTLDGYEGMKKIPADALFRRFRHHSDVLWEQYKTGALTLGRMRVERLQRTLADFGIRAYEEDCIAFQQAYQEGQYRIRLHAGAADCLKQLREAGCLLGIVTNGPRSHQTRKLEALGIETYIPRTRWFISGAVGMAKPDPELFAYVNEMTGTEPAGCVMVGDSLVNDVRGAAGAGWRTVWFNFRGQADADERQADADCSAAHNADLTAASYAGLAERIMNLLT